MYETNNALPLLDAQRSQIEALDVRDLSGRPHNAPGSEQGKRRPNVVIVLLDDMGFGAPSTFGGPCNMPVADALASAGLRYTRFHTTGICSPTRAALLTGSNHHAVGMGYVTDMATPQPGYSGRMPRSSATIAKILKENGYATGAFGKMHETPRDEISPIGPFDRWPTQGMGFEKYFGFMGGEMNQWNPALFEGTTPVVQEREPEEGFHFSEAIVDKAIEWVGEVRAMAPEKPFFCYLPFGATHSPFHVPPEWPAKYKGLFDHGWDRQRDITLARQIELGIVPNHTELGPWPAGVPSWDELSSPEKEAASLLMELYAGFAEHADAQVGRMVEFLKDTGEFDNTLFIYILGDNGASPEGGISGTPSEYHGWNNLPVEAKDILDARDELGGVNSWPHYSTGWALAMDTPYQWTKQIASHYGGTRNGLVVSYPNSIDAAGGLRHQWHHVIDMTPTILEAVGIKAPDTVNGVTQRSMDGIPMNYSFSTGDVADMRRTQYFEIGGSRAVYHEGWVACAAHRSTPWDLLHSESPAYEDDRWELYDTRTDWSQSKDLASQHPKILQKLKDLFIAEAGRNQVFPLDDRSMRERRNAEERNSLTTMTFRGHVSRVPHDAIPNVIGKSFSIFMELETPEQSSGVLCVQGGRFTGYALYLTDGKLNFCYNVGRRVMSYIRSYTVISPGFHQVEFKFERSSSDMGSGGDGRLLLDGVEVGRGTIERTAAFMFPAGEDFSVGHDPMTPVTPEYAIRKNEFDGSVKTTTLRVQDEAEVTDYELRMRAEVARQ